MGSNSNHDSEGNIESDHVGVGKAPQTSLLVEKDQSTLQESKLFG